MLLLAQMMAYTLQRTFDLLVYKTYAELKAEAERTYIGLLWWILEPIIFMMIFYFVFGILFDRSTENFIPFLLIGLIVWHWFQATVTQCSNSIVTNRPLIQQVVVPKPLFPFVMISTNTIKFTVVLAILMLYLIFYGIEVRWSWLWATVPLATLLLLITGASMILAAVVPLIPDIRVIIDNAFRGLFFLSGIFYDVSTLPPRFAEALHWNPIARLIHDVRGVFLEGAVPDLLASAAIASASICALWAGLILMKINRSTYAKSVV